MVFEAMAIPPLTRLFVLTSTLHTEAPGSPSVDGDALGALAVGAADQRELMAAHGIGGERSHGGVRQA